MQFPQRCSDEACLYIYEEKDVVPFSVKRTFVISAHEKCDRGFHAHKLCSQLLIPLKGSCTVVCDDGKNRKDFLLDSPQQGLLVPPTIWAEQKYSAGTILMVLTDQPYDEADYIRKYDDFLMFRGVQ